MWYIESRGIFTSKVIKHSYGQDSSYGTAAVFLIMTVFGASTATTSITLGHLTSGKLKLVIAITIVTVKNNNNKKTESYGQFPLQD